LRSGGSALLAEAIKTQAPYLPCFAASDPVFSAEECRKILAIGQARPARAGGMQSTAGSWSTSAGPISRDGYL